VDELNQRLREGSQEKKLKKATKTLEEKHLPRLQKYEEQERLVAGRRSYSKTDPDASSLRMKEDRAASKPLARPTHNIQMGTGGSLGWATAFTSKPVILLVSFPIHNSISFHRGGSSRPSVGKVPRMGYAG